MDDPIRPEFGQGATAPERSAFSLASRFLADADGPSFGDMLVRRSLLLSNSGRALYGRPRKKTQARAL
jgi:hypothetical protein